MLQRTMSGIEYRVRAVATPFTVRFHNSDTYGTSELDVIFDGVNFWEAGNPAIMIRGYDSRTAHRQFKFHGPKY